MATTKRPSTRTGRARLLKLADLLEADAKKKDGIKFNLSTWVKSKGAPELSCGTQACAMGLAAISGAFRKQGLDVDPIDLEPDYNGIVMVTPRFKVSEAWQDYAFGTRAAEHLFDIDPNEADWLFMPGRYRGLPRRGAEGERAVATRIRDFVAGRKRPGRSAWL